MAQQHRRGVRLLQGREHHGQRRAWRASQCRPVDDLRLPREIWQEQGDPPCRCHLERPGADGHEEPRLRLQHPQGQQTEGLLGRQLLGLGFQCRSCVGELPMGHVGGLQCLLPVGQAQRPAEELHLPAAEGRVQLRAAAQHPHWLCRRYEGGGERMGGRHPGRHARPLPQRPAGAAVVPAPARVCHQQLLAQRRCHRQHHHRPRLRPEAGQRPLPRQEPLRRLHPAEPQLLPHLLSERGHSGAG